MKQLICQSCMLQIADGNVNPFTICHYFVINPEEKFTILFFVIHLQFLREGKKISSGLVAFHSFVLFTFSHFVRRYTTFVKSTG